jgi:type I restriction enzyme M protein
LEGLEAIEILLSGLNEERRIDSQYFRKRYIAEDACRRHFRTITLGSQAFITDGPHGYHVVDESSAIAMLTAKCAKQWFADRSEADTIDVATHESSLRSSLEVDDLILSTRGTVGACALVEPEALPANIDQDVARIAIQNGGDISPRFALAYLNSKFGQDWIERNSTGMVQQGLSLAKVRELPIPLLSVQIQDQISNLVRMASSARKRSKELMSSAENNLLHALGLNTWTPPEALNYVRSSSDAFAAGRLDAEHYQPRFSALLRLIEATGEGARLGDCLLENKRGKQPDYADVGLPVVNSKQVLRNDVRLDADNRLATFAADDLLISTGDVLINGTGVGTIGRAAAYMHERQAIPDNHVTILRPKNDLDSVYLSMFLNSIAGQFQVEQRLRGSSGQIELYPNDIAEFRVWIAPIAIQKSIREQVEQSFAQKQRATQLLDAAKHAVEIAIEDSEAAALTYLKGLM